MMKNFKKILTYLAFLSLIAISLSSLPIKSRAEENGAAVQTNGVIQFYEDSSSESSNSESSSSERNSSESNSSTPKPTGKYPSTGELVQKSMAISGFLLIALLLVFFFFKRKKDKDEKEAN